MNSSLVKTSCRGFPVSVVTTSAMPALPATKASRTRRRTRARAAKSSAAQRACTSRARATAVATASRSATGYSATRAPVAGLWISIVRRTSGSSTGLAPCAMGAPPRRHRRGSPRTGSTSCAEHRYLRCDGSRPLRKCRETRRREIVAVEQLPGRLARVVADVHDATPAGLHESPSRKRGRLCRPLDSPYSIPYSVAMKATVTSKGQITIPLAIRRKLKLDRGTVLEFDEGADHLKATKSVDVDRMRAVIGIARDKLAGKSVDGWMEELRGRVRLPRRRRRR